MRRLQRTVGGGVILAILGVAVALGWFTFIPILNFFRALPPWVFLPGLLIAVPAFFLTGFTALWLTRDMMDEIPSVKAADIHRFAMRIALSGICAYACFWAALLADVI